MNYLFLFLLSFAYADVESTNLLEKTWGRDNCFCHLNKKRVEVLIRGQNKTIETKEYGLGEYAFYRIGEEDEEAFVLPINKFQSGLYRFFKGKGPYCSKGLGFPLKNEKFAILFLRMNRPYGSKLVIQLFDFKTLKPLDVIETNLVTLKAQQVPDGFIFKTKSERSDMDMGKVKISDIEFVYQDREFPLWMKYDLKGLRLDQDVTFNKLPWRKYFKDEADFLKLAEWDDKAKAFKRSIPYFAINHALKKKCIFFSSSKFKPLGTEDWHCVQAI